MAFLSQARLLCELAGMCSEHLSLAAAGHVNACVGGQAHYVFMVGYDHRDWEVMMLVYCSRISLVHTSDDAAVLGAIAGWLREKPGLSDVDPAMFRDEGDTRLADRSFLEWLAVEHEGEQWRSVRYGHPDRGDAHGREWLTDIGVWRNRDAFTCSVMLHTREQSALVDPNVQTTRPKVVADIFAKCRVASNTSGGTVRQLRIADAEAFMYEVHDPERTHPIVQISYDAAGKYLIGPERAASLLAGVAVVTAIPPDVDTFALEDALDGRYCCYHGAVNIIWPCVKSGAQRYVPFQRIMAHQIEAVRAGGSWPESQLLATVCHRMNEVYARDHISPEIVRAAKHRAALAEARKSAPKPDPELEDLMRKVDADQRAEIAQLKGELKQRDEQLAEARGDLEVAGRNIETLKASLSQAGRRTDGPAPTAVTEDARAAMLAAASEDFSLSDVLDLLAVLFPERLVILDSARKSARDASDFKYPRRAFSLLHTLCSDYWQALADGKGDSVARATLGNAYSGKESETVEKNKRARKLRTFTYKGKPNAMMAHLKIGTKDSRTETWRAHFLWDADERKIVLGHCGKHLDHK